MSRSLDQIKILQIYLLSSNVVKKSKIQMSKSLLHIMLHTSFAGCGKHFFA